MTSHIREERAEEEKKKQKQSKSSAPNMPLNLLMAATSPYSGSPQLAIKSVTGREAVLELPGRRSSLERTDLLHLFHSHSHSRPNNRPHHPPVSHRGGGAQGEAAEGRGCAERRRPLFLSLKKAKQTFGSNRSFNHRVSHTFRRGRMWQFSIFAEHLPRSPA